MVDEISFDEFMWSRPIAVSRAANSVTSFVNFCKNLPTDFQLKVALIVPGRLFGLFCKMSIKTAETAF